MGIGELSLSLSLSLSLIIIIIIHVASASAQRAAAPGAPRYIATGVVRARVRVRIKRLLRSRTAPRDTVLQSQARPARVGEWAEGFGAARERRRVHAKERRRDAVARALGSGLRPGLLAAAKVLTIGRVGTYTHTSGLTVQTDSEKEIRVDEKLPKTPPLSARMLQLTAGLAASAALLSGALKSPPPTRTNGVRMLGNLFGMMQEAQMVTKDKALPGRSQKMMVPDRHFVLGNKMEGPFPEGYKVAVFANGCFWGSEKGIWRLPGDGIYTTAVGYCAGYTPNPTYEEACSGMSGHTEGVQVVYDPAKISFVDILRWFWEAHDPTSGMGQGNDRGTPKKRNATLVHGSLEPPPPPPHTPLTLRVIGVDLYPE